MVIEVIDDTPRAPLRFVRTSAARRRRRRANSQSLSGGGGSGVVAAAPNAPLFKFQIAACYVIGHASEAGAFMVRIDDLAFTVLYYDSDPLLAAGGGGGGGGGAAGSLVPQRWNSLTTAPLQLSASLGRSVDGTDTVTVRGSNLRLVVNDAVARNAAALAAVARSVRSAVNANQAAAATAATAGPKAVRGSGGAGRSRGGAKAAAASLGQVGGGWGSSDGSSDDDSPGAPTAAGAAADDDLEGRGGLGEVLEVGSEIDLPVRLPVACPLGPLSTATAHVCCFFAARNRFAAAAERRLPSTGAVGTCSSTRRASTWTLPAAR